jgi:two-component system NtrC family sensor kinase
MRENERILLVESNPDISNLIARSILRPLGYHVKIVNAAAPAIQEAADFAPDVILADLDLPDLSGKDLLIALSSQGIGVPIIVIAGEGMEHDVVQAFRLGAADCLSWPAREAEVLSSVERVIKQVRNQRESERLTRQLNRTNRDLQTRVRELTTIFAIGKSVVSTMDKRSLFNKIIEAALYLAEADRAWLLIREEENKAFILRAAQNVPASVIEKINHPWDDGLSSLAVLSGESLSIHGDPLRRFKTYQLGQAALVVPVRVNHEVLGLLVVMRSEAKPFTNSQQTLLESLGDYASIALVNARLFKGLEKKVQDPKTQQSLDIEETESYVTSNQDEFDKISKYTALAQEHIDNLLNRRVDDLLPDQRDVLELLQDITQKISDLINNYVIGSE